MPVPRNSQSSGQNPPGREAPGGIRIGPGFGKGRFRVRQRLVVDHYAPLIRARGYGAVKLDIVLRCVALLPEHAGRRHPGHVLRRWTFEDLHDLIKEDPETRPGTTARREQQTVKLKRKWVANQLHKLEQHKLVQVTERPGRTPQLTVLRDDGSGRPYDDPGGAARYEPYFTIQGSLIASGEFRSWGAPEVAAYFACLLAELHHDRGAGRKIRPGHETWWRPLAWFREDEWDPPRRTILPFSTTLLDEGISSLRRRGMIAVNLVTKNPRDGRRLPRPRNVYQDNFDRFDAETRPVEDVTAAVDAELAGEAAEPPTSFADTVIQGVADEQKRAPTTG